MKNTNTGGGAVHINILLTPWSIKLLYLHKNDRPNRSLVYRRVGRSALTRCKIVKQNLTLLLLVELILNNVDNVDNYSILIHLIYIIYNFYAIASTEITSQFVGLIGTLITTNLAKKQK